MANVHASIRPSGLDRTPVAAMSGRLGFKFLRGWVDGRVETCPSGNEDSDDEDSDWSPNPPWIQMAACDWASFAHRLLLRQELRDKHYMTHKGQDVFKQYKLLHYARHLRALAKGEHPLSTIDKLDFYLNGRFR